MEIENIRRRGKITVLDLKTNEGYYEPFILKKCCGDGFMLMPFDAYCSYYSYTYRRSVKHINFNEINDAIEYIRLHLDNKLKVKE